MDKIRAEGMRFVDEQGRERIFHGLNLKNDSEKVRDKPPAGNLAFLDETFFQRCKASGLCLLRLGVNWENLEPEKGNYNEAYLQVMDQIFDLGAAYGVYIFIDMHQDLYSSFGKFVGGNGMPAWACNSDGYAPKPIKFVWAEGYFWGKAVQRSFSHFWNNDPVLGKGLLDHFAEVWQMLARRYGDHPALFGFDLLNEPYPGTMGGQVFRRLVGKMIRVSLVSPTVNRMEFIRNAIRKESRGKALDVLSPAVMKKVTSAGTKLIRKFDTEQYTPFVAKMQKALREVTPNGFLIMEHSYYSNLGIPYSAEPPKEEPNVCYTPHGYDFTVDTPAYKYANNARVGFMFEESRRGQLRMQVPALVGEWGGGGEGESFFPHIEYLLNLFDSYHWGNTYFTYSETLFDQPLMRLLERPYPMAVNGRIKQFRVDPKAKVLTLDYTPAERELPTEIHLPKGYERIEAGEGAAVTLEGNVLKVITKAPNITVYYK